MIDISVNHPDNFLTYSVRLRTYASQEFGRYFPISLMCRNEILMTAAPREKLAHLTAINNVQLWANNTKH